MAYIIDNLSSKKISRYDYSPLLEIFLKTSSLFKHVVSVKKFVCIAIDKAANMFNLYIKHADLEFLI